MSEKRSEETVVFHRIAEGVEVEEKLAMHVGEFLGFQKGEPPKSPTRDGEVRVVRYSGWSAYRVR